MSASPVLQATEVFKALSDPLRVRILGLLLRAGELCVCEVESTLDISQPRASRQLTALRRAGLVVDRRDGAWAHYSIPKSLSPLAKAALDGLRSSLVDDPVVQADLDNLKKVCC